MGSPGASFSSPLGSAPALPQQTMDFLSSAGAQVPPQLTMEYLTAGR